MEMKSVKQQEKDLLMKYVKRRRGEGRETRIAGKKNTEFVLGISKECIRPLTGNKTELNKKVR